MATGAWADAADQLTLDAAAYGESDRVMFMLNLGTLKHYAGDEMGSQTALVDAEARMRDLWTRSVTAEASKFLFIETSASYRGEDFEQVLLYLFTSLNHAQHGNLDDALVEARRADEFLKWLKNRHRRAGSDTLYVQDAFMLWLVGLYYEMEGSLEDARLAYRDSVTAYRREYRASFGTPAPSFVARDLERVSMGEALEPDRGELVVFHANGEAPYKRELTFNAEVQDDYWMRVAVPELVPVGAAVAYAEVRAAAGVARTEVAEPVSKIAVTNFRHQLPGIKGRAVARAAIKYAGTKTSQAIAHEAGGEGWGAVVGLLGAVVSVATEAADLRSWTTLPAEIGVARLALPPGRHDVLVRFYDRFGSEVRRAQRHRVIVPAGGRALLSTRTL